MRSLTVLVIHMFWFNCLDHFDSVVCRVTLLLVAPNIDVLHTTDHTAFPSRAHGLTPIFMVSVLLIVLVFCVVGFIWGGFLLIFCVLCHVCPMLSVFLDCPFSKTLISFIPVRKQQMFYVLDRRLFDLFNSWIFNI